MGSKLAFKGRLLEGGYAVAWLVGEKLVVQICKTVVNFNNAKHLVLTFMRCLILRVFFRVFGFVEGSPNVENSKVYYN